jgi:drug/metabolite transporter (DMT)-like permease
MTTFSYEENAGGMTIRKSMPEGAYKLTERDHIFCVHKLMNVASVSSEMQMLKNLSSVEEFNTAMTVIFFLISLVFFGMLWEKGHVSSISLSLIYTNYELLYQVIGPTSVGYLFWYIAMKKGNRNLITSLSFFIPVLSVLVIGLKFRVAIGAVFWIAVMLLIAGSNLCYRSFQSRVRPNDRMQ